MIQDASLLPCSQPEGPLMFVQVRGKRYVYESPWLDENGEGKGECAKIRGDKVLRGFPEVTPSRQAMTRRVTGVLLVTAPAALRLSGHPGAAYALSVATRPPFTVVSPAVVISPGATTISRDSRLGRSRVRDS